MILATPSFRQFFTAVMSGLSTGALKPNLKSVALTLTDILAFNEQILQSRVILVTPPFTVFWHFLVWRPPSDVVWSMNRYNWSRDNVQKCLNTPIENALRRRQIWVKWGKNGGYPYWILTRRKSSFVLSFQIPDLCDKFHHNRLKTVTMRARTDTQTHRQTEMTWVIL